VTATTVQLSILRVTGVLGAVLFGFFFVLTFSTPQWVERFAVEFIEARVSERVNSGIDGLRPEGGEGMAARIAQELYDLNRAEIEDQSQRFRNGVRETWAEALAEVRDLSCECRKKWLDLLEAGTVRHLDSLEMVGRRIKDFIQGNYMEVVTELKRDIRIFTATNAGMFLLMVLVSFLKPGAVRHLFAPALLLCAATLFSAYLYVFEQNWLLTIVQGSYVGFAYAAYLGLVFLFLCDIALNRGRVTTRLVNGVVHSFGGMSSLVPC